MNIFGIEVENRLQERSKKGEMQPEEFIKIFVKEQSNGYREIAAIYF